MRPSLVTVLNQVSGSNSFTSSAIYAWDIVRASFQVVCNSASFTGTVKFQASNDLPVGVPAPYFQPTNWNDIGSSSITCSTTATTRSAISQALEMGYGYIRVVGQSSGPSESLMSVTFKGIGL